MKVKNRTLSLRSREDSYSINTYTLPFSSTLHKRDK